jgi:SAM-dependent methyltransferase
MRLLPRRRSRSTTTLEFTCNICGAPNRVETAAVAREANTCSLCGSILRWRSVIAALSIARYGRSIPVEEFPPDRATIGLGMSDWDVYASRLAKVFAYTNTFYDEEPRFDVMAPVGPDRAGTYDFIISSDVLEHVAPPYETALANLRRLLKPGGVLILSVPMTSAEHTDEHFPDLHQYDIAHLGDTPVLVNRTTSGAIQVFEDLVFHGGAGATLEMRVFSAPELLDRLWAAGFEEVLPFDTEVPEHGVVWNEPGSWPIVARVPGAAATAR